MEERELVKQLKEKNKKAFSYLYDHYAGSLYGIVYRTLQDEDLAQEVLHDAFMKIWDQIERYDPGKGKLFTWMLNITRNLAIDKRRSKQFKQGQKTDSIENNVYPLEQSKSHQLEVDGIGWENLLKEIPDEQRAVLKALYYEGYTQAEWAEKTNIPLGTIKTRTRSGLKKLRTLLKKEN